MKTCPRNVSNVRDDELTCFSQGKEGERVKGWQIRTIASSVRGTESQIVRSSRPRNYDSSRYDFFCEIDIMRNRTLPSCDCFTVDTSHPRDIVTDARKEC